MYPLSLARLVPKVTYVALCRCVASSHLFQPLSASLSLRINQLPLSLALLLPPLSVSASQLTSQPASQLTKLYNLTSAYPNWNPEVEEGCVAVG